MAYGEGGASNFAGTGGYGGQFPGYGGASAGYTGGYGNPTSVGQGTAGQTQNSVAYANTLNKYNPSLPNYSGVDPASGTTGGGWHYGGTTSSTTTTTKKPTTTTTKKPTTTTTPTTTYQKSTPTTSSYNPYGGYPNASQFNGSEYPDWAGGSWQNINNNPTPQQDLSDARGYPSHGWAGPHYGGRQFGGPVRPGGQYTVGENGPETLQMGAQGGQVIPNNPVDRLGGMNPGMMQALFQLMQQRRPQMNPGQAPVGQPAPMPTPQPPQMRPPMGQSPGGPMGQSPGAGGGFRLGDWRNRMGIEGLSRPPRQGMGFGGSGLGMPGIMPQMRGQVG